ncbi:MAG: radical SAM protein, partial [Gammaproteobacteria bacterium]
MFNDYVDPVYRPPSEANSLILQVTIGCSWNRCTFCEMYTDPAKKFRVRGEDEIEAQLIRVAASGMPVRRVFLADGDAMSLSTRRLGRFLELIRTHLPGVQRVSAYCLPRNLRNKGIDDLERLRDLGLQLLYVGCESGDDTVLERVSKGETFESSRQSLDKMRTAGLKRSIMILNGLGGTAYSEQHAINSARLMNEAQPDFLSTLVVTFPKGDRR